MRRCHLLLIPLFVGHFAAAAQIVEEVVAVVDSTPILRSDIALSELVRLVNPVSSDSPDVLQSLLLDARIRLELQYRDLEDSGTLYRLDLDVDKGLELLVLRAGGEDALRARLPQHGLAWVDVEELALRIAAASAYADQRLRPRVSVSLQELQTAYQEVVVSQNEAQGLPAPPLTTVQDDLHKLLVERKLNEEIQQWLTAAGERHEVTRFVR